MLEGKGIYIKNFGTFVFEIIKKAKLPAQHIQFDPSQTAQESFTNRTNVNQVRPCFIPDNPFQTALTRFNNKSEVDVAGSQSSAFQKGVNVLYCNPTPIAGRTSLSRDVVQSSLIVIFQAIIDLTKSGMGMNLDFGLLQMNIENKNMNYKYSPAFTEKTSRPNFSDCVAFRLI